MLDDDIITEETAGSWPGGEKFLCFSSRKRHRWILGSAHWSLVVWKQPPPSSSSSSPSPLKQLPEETEDSHEARKKLGAVILYILIIIIRSVVGGAP